MNIFYYYYVKLYTLYKKHQDFTMFDDFVKKCQDVTRFYNLVNILQDFMIQ